MPVVNRAQFFDTVEEVRFIFRATLRTCISSSSRLFFLLNGVHTAMQLSGHDFVASRGDADGSCINALPASGIHTG